MTARKTGSIQTISAAKAGISERSGREIEHGRRNEQRKEHLWRTCEDPLRGAFESELIPLLEKEPRLTPMTLLEELQQRHPDQYSEKILRTLERRVKKWKAIYGPEKEVIFRQKHILGHWGISDFTHLKGVTITIRETPLKHMLYHFRLACSGWSSIKVTLGGESYTALTEGLQDALWQLGGSPLEHRTDSLSSAFKNLTKDEQQDITKQYKQFCGHYHMTATRNNLGVRHENGSIESPHGHVKRRIEQALLLRGSTNFESVGEYQQFLDRVVTQHNQRNAPLIHLERQTLQALPVYRMADYTTLFAKVTSSSTIQVHRMTYSVPSRLIGETLCIHLYDNRLCAYIGSALVVTLSRVYTKGSLKHSIDYRHVIDSLVRKPQAFRYSQIRDDLLPTEAYRQIWDYVDKTLPPKSACRFIVGLLKLAARGNEEKLAQETLASIKKSKLLTLHFLEKKYEKSALFIPEIIIPVRTSGDYDFLLRGAL